MVDLLTTNSDVPIGIFFNKCEQGSFEYQWGKIRRLREVGEGLVNQYRQQVRQISFTSLASEGASLKAFMNSMDAFFEEAICQSILYRIMEENESQLGSSKPSGISQFYSKHSMCDIKMTMVPCEPRDS